MPGYDREQERGQQTQTSAPKLSANQEEQEEGQGAKGHADGPANQIGGGGVPAFVVEDGEFLIAGTLVDQVTGLQKQAVRQVGESGVEAVDGPELTMLEQRFQVSEPKALIPESGGVEVGRREPEPESETPDEEQTEKDADGRLGQTVGFSELE